MTNSTPAGTEAKRNASAPQSSASRESLEELGVSTEQDLDAAEAEKRLEEAGPNVLARDQLDLDPYESLTDACTVVTCPVDNLNCSSAAARDVLTGACR